MNRYFTLRHACTGCGCFPCLCCCCGCRVCWDRSVVAKVEMPTGAKIGELSLMEGSRHLELTLIRRPQKTRAAKKKPPPQPLRFHITLPKNGTEGLLKNAAANKSILQVKENANGKKNVGRLELSTYETNTVQARTLSYHYFPSKI